MEHVRIPRCYGRLRKFTCWSVAHLLMASSRFNRTTCCAPLTAPLLFMAKMNFLLIMMVNFIAVFAINIWSICLTLRLLGAKNSYKNLVFGLSHFLIVLAVFGTLLVLTLFYRMFLTETMPSSFVLYALNALSVLLFLIVSWVGLLAIHFVKVTSSLSYIKTVLGMGFSIACIDLLLLVLVPKML